MALRTDMERVEALQHSRKEHVQEAVNGLRRDLVAVMPQVRPSGGGDEDEREDDGMDAEDMLEAYSQWTEWCDAAGASADGARCCPQPSAPYHRTGAISSAPHCALPQVPCHRRADGEQNAAAARRARRGAGRGARADGAAQASGA